MNDWLMFLSGFCLAAGIWSFANRDNGMGIVQICTAVILIIVRYV